MRVFLLFIAASVLAMSGYATVDTDSDQIGVYFDLDANETCISVAPSIPFFAYVVVTNPSVPEVLGFEFSYRVAVPAGLEGLVFRLQNASPCWIWPGNPWYEGDYVCGLASPAPMTGSNVIVITWQFMLLAPGVSMEFFLGPAYVESIADGLPAYAVSDGILPLGVSSGDIGLPVAAVNGDCRVVSVNNVTFGALKGLFR
jgi:hypothetical protein